MTMKHFRASHYVTCLLSSEEKTYSAHFDEENVEIQALNVMNSNMAHW